MNPSVAVVVLTYNNLSFVKQFFPTLLEHSAKEATIWVVDNGSSDGTVAYIEQHFEDVQIIALPQNLGFTGGYNAGLKQISADYYVLLNSDVAVMSNWITPIIEVMEADKTVGVAQPKMMSFDNPSRFDYAGAAGGIIDRLGYPYCQGRIFDTIEEDRGQYDTTQPIFWASGAAMFVRAELYHELGGLEEDFFAHMEEIDFCWRAKKAGYQVLSVPASTVYHVGGGTLAATSPKKTYLNFRNSLITLYRNYEGGNLWGTIFLRMVLDGLAAVKFLMAGDIKHIFAILKAHFYCYGNFKSISHRKKEVLQRIAQAKIGDSTASVGMLSASIVQHYFLKGKKIASEL